MPAAPGAGQADPLRGEQLPGAQRVAAWRTLDRASPARWAHKWLMCSIGCDERQRLRRPVFLDSASTHGHSPSVTKIYTGQGFDALATASYLSGQQEVGMEPPRTVFQPLAEIEIDAVSPSNQGFTLTGQGAGTDRSEYRLDLHFELPLDKPDTDSLGRAPLAVGAYHLPPGGGDAAALTPPAARAQFLTPHRGSYSLADP